jgi:hypothetical protein
MARPYISPSIVDTPRKNQKHAREATADGDFVEVTDPIHPLFQRTFQLLAVSRGSGGTFHVTVRYRGDIALRLPLQCTSMSDLAKNTIRSKLTAEAVRELLAFVKENESCPHQPRKSGKTSRPKCGKKSPKKSTASSRR